MSECTDIQLIYDTEFIGDSLSKINTNFQLLSGAACQIHQLLEAQVNIRTFFYYGPNSPNNTTEFDNEQSRPSNQTIERFVNNEIQLPAISDDGDYAWVIYQRTGWRNLFQEFERKDSGQVAYTRLETFFEQQTQIVEVQVPVYYTISIGRAGTFKKWKTEYQEQTFTVPVDRPVTYYAPYNWSVSIPDQFREYAPIFVIYKLRYNGNTKTYSMLTGEGFPKYTRAATASTNNWNQPELWNIY
jgi:hypothetical protein